MTDLKHIEAYYSTMSLEGLRRLTAKPHELRMDVIPILQHELIAREQYQEAQSLVDYMERSQEAPRYTELSIVELRQLVDERLAAGEYLDSIKLDLQDHGINVYDIINMEGPLREQAFDYVTHLKQQGMQEDQIDTLLQESLSLDQEETKQLKAKLKESGRRNLVFGYTLTGIAVILVLALLGLSGRAPLGVIGVLGIGIWRIFRGYAQLKD